MEMESIPQHEAPIWPPNPERVSRVSDRTARAELRAMLPPWREPQGQAEKTPRMQQLQGFSSHFTVFFMKVDLTLCGLIIVATSTDKDLTHLNSIRSNRTTLVSEIRPS